MGDRVTATPRWRMPWAWVPRGFVRRRTLIYRAESFVGNMRKRVSKGKGARLYSEFRLGNFRHGDEGDFQAIYAVLMSR